MPSKALSFEGYYGSKAFQYSKVFKYGNDQIKYQVYSKIQSEFIKRGEKFQEVVDYLENVYLPGIQQFSSFADHIPLFEREIQLMKTSKEEAIEQIYSEQGFLEYRIIEENKIYYVCELDAIKRGKWFSSHQENMYWSTFQTYKRKYAATRFLLDWLHCQRQYIDPKYQFDPELAEFARNLASGIANAMNEIIEDSNNSDPPMYI